MRRDKALRMIKNFLAIVLYLNRHCVNHSRLTNHLLKFYGPKAESLLLKEYKYLTENICSCHLHIQAKGTAVVAGLCLSSGGDVTLSVV